MSGPAVPSVTAGLVAASRNLRELGSFHEGLPAWVVDAFGVLTHLGDAWLVVGLATLTYLAYDRRAGGFVVGALLVGFAATVALKTWFAWPRPPAELAHVVESGFGFPSGHAIGATVTWGALAIGLEEISTVRRRATVALVVIVAVAVSRVALGVHYLGDVVAGVAVGLVVLGVAVRWGRDAPQGLFALGVVVALAAVVISGGTWQAVALLGAGVGAVAAWQAVEPADRVWERRGVGAVGGAGVLAAGVTALADPTDAVVFGVATLLMAAIIAGPVARERWLAREVTRERARG